MTSILRIHFDRANIFISSTESTQMNMSVSSIMLKTFVKLISCNFIVLMLDRLRMIIENALRTYNKIAEFVFCKSNRKHFFKNETFKTTTLEKQIQNLIVEKALKKYILYEKDEANATKIFVCTVSAINMTHPRLFKFYTVRENANTNCKIWKAARATTATPIFFKRMTIINDENARKDFLNGGLRFNNSAQLILSETFTIFESVSKLECLISIETGHPDIIKLSQSDAFQKILFTNMIEILKQIATNCEQPAHELAKRFQQLLNRYFRYSVSHEIDSISLEKWKKMNEIQVHTKAYLTKIEISSSINKLIEFFCRTNETQWFEFSLQSICQSWFNTEKVIHFFDPFWFVLVLQKTNVETDLIVSESATESTSKLSVRYRSESSSFFTDRKEFLNALTEFFIDQSSEQHLRREYLLFGMRDAGKIQIALKFAESYHQKQVHVNLFTCSLWLINREQMWTRFLNWCKQ